MLQLASAVESLDSAIYGSSLLLEELLPGHELTIPIFPPGLYHLNGKLTPMPEHWASPPMLRTGHHDGVVPYSGLVPVSVNSRVLHPEERAHPQVLTAMQACAKAAALLNTRTVARIDCRQSDSGEYKLFDFNLKPNMTGPGRPGRDDQDSLVSLSTAAIGWDYTELVRNIAAQARPLTSSIPNNS